MTLEQNNLIKKLIITVYPEKASTLKNEPNIASEEETLTYLLAKVISEINPNYCIETWHYDDVKGRCDENGISLTDNQIHTVLRLLTSEHDAEQGINWDTIDYWIDYVNEQSKQIAQKAN